MILLAVSLSLYAAALRAGFVTDDKIQLQDNAFITSYRYIPQIFATHVWGFHPSQISNYYRPIQMLFYMGEYYMFGLDSAWPWHLVALLLNVADVFAAYFLVRALADERIALLAALLFACHPIHVEAVVWIAALPELLCALCYFTALRFYHRARTGEHPARNETVATAIFFGGLFCKEMMLAFPAVLLAYEFFYRRESLRAICRGFRRFLPYLCALAVYVAIRVKVLGTFAPGFTGFHPHFTRLQKFLSVPVLLCQYVFKSLLPTNLNYFYHFVPQDRPDGKFIADAALLGGLIGAAVWLRKTQPVMAFALAWFFVTLIPVMGISNVGVNVFTERYLYIPSLGFCMLAAQLWLRWKDTLSRRTTLAGAYSVLAVVLAFYAFQIERRIPDWRSDLRLFQKTATQTPDLAMVHFSLGMAYYDDGQFDRAIAPLERSLTIDPKAYLAHLYLALTFSALGSSEEAGVHLRMAELLQEGPFTPWSLFAQAHANLKQWDRAIEYDRKEIESEPQNPVLYTALGEALQANGQTEDSIAAFRRAIQLEPGFLDASINLGITLAQEGDTNDAIDILASALRSNPSGVHADAAWFNLGNVYAHERRWKDAAAAYEHALEVNPDLNAARQRLDSVEAEAETRQQ